MAFLFVTSFFACMLFYSCHGMSTIIPGIILHAQPGTNPPTIVYNHTNDDIEIVINFNCNAQLTAYSIFAKSYAQRYATSVSIDSPKVHVKKRSHQTIRLDPIKKYGIWWNNTHVVNARAVKSFSIRKGTDHYHATIVSPPESNQLIITLENPA